MSELRTKNIAQGFKDVDVKQGIISGYFASFNFKDSDGETIIKGAFQKTIQENGPQSAHPRIKHLLDHDKKNAVATIQRLYEDDFGLAYESKAGRHANGRDFLLMVEDGIITEHSIGYSTVKGLWDEAKETYFLKEIRLYEGSSLQFYGANQHTPITGVKAQSIMFKELTRLEDAVRNGKYTDETHLKLYKRIKSLYQVLKPVGTTSQPLEPNLFEVITNNFK